MRIKRKIVNQLLLTPEEVNLLLGLVDKASEGQTVHYAEAQVGPNQYFGVSVDPKNAMPEPVMPKPELMGLKKY